MDDCYHDCDAAIASCPLPLGRRREEAAEDGAYAFTPTTIASSNQETVFYCTSCDTQSDALVLRCVQKPSPPQGPVLGFVNADAAKCRQQPEFRHRSSDVVWEHRRALPGPYYQPQQPQRVPGVILLLRPAQSRGALLSPHMSRIHSISSR